MPRQPIEDRFYRTVVDALSHDKLVLPTLPEIAARIGQMTRNPEVQIARLAGEIGKDPAISVRLLRVANSAAHGGGRARVSTLPQAVMRLGLEMTRLLVSGLAMEQAFTSPVPSLRERLRRCWAESVETGALAQVIAARRSPVQPELAMLAGLVHQVGVLPILRLAEKHPEMTGQPQVLDAVIEALAPRIGRMVLQAWGFPPELVAVPAGCRDFARRHEGQADLADVVTVASLQTSRDPRMAQVDRGRVPAYAALGLDPAIGLEQQFDAVAALAEGRALLAA